MLKGSDLVLFATVISATTSDNGRLVINLDHYEQVLKGRKPQHSIMLKMYSSNDQNPVRVGNSGLFFLRLSEEKYYVPVDPNLGVMEQTILVCEGTPTFGYVPAARGELLRDVPASRELPCDSKYHNVAIKVP